jgi:hypothetical protein
MDACLHGNASVCAVCDAKVQIDWVKIFASERVPLDIWRFEIFEYLSADERLACRLTCTKLYKNLKHPRNHVYKFQKCPICEHRIRAIKPKKFRNRAGNVIGKKPKEKTMTKPSLGSTCVLNDCGCYMHARCMAFVKRTATGPPIMDEFIANSWLGALTNGLLFSYKDPVGAVDHKNCINRRRLKEKKDDV